MTDRINLNAPFQSFRLLPSRPSHLLKETNQLDLISRNKHATTWESEEGTAREGESVNDVHFIFGFGDWTHCRQNLFIQCLFVHRFGLFLAPRCEDVAFGSPI